MERKGSTALTVVASAILAFAFVLGVLLLLQGIANATMVTCDGPPPEAWRRSVAWTGFGIATALDLGGAALVVRGGGLPMVIAIALAALSMAASVIALLIPALAAGMC